MLYSVFRRFWLFCVYNCSLKLECEKLAQEKTEMQRHYVMVTTFIYVLNNAYWIVKLWNHFF